MSESIPECFQERLTSGRYANMIHDIGQLGTSFLGNATFNRDFVRVAPRWPPHYSYKAKLGNSEKEYHTIVFGEIASPALGTTHCAAGNHSFEAGENMVHLISPMHTRLFYNLSYRWHI